MPFLAPAFALIAALTVVAGSAKLRFPGTAGAAMSEFGLPGSAPIVRIIGSAELSLGLACLLSPAPALAVLLSLAYLVFAAVVFGLLRKGATSVDCGCFGAGSFAPTRAHVVFDLLAAAVAATASITPPPGPLDWLSEPLAGTAAIVAVGCSVWLAYVIFTLVPTSWAAPTR